MDVPPSIWTHVWFWFGVKLNGNTIHVSFFEDLRLKVVDSWKGFMWLRQKAA